jgi:hypothetical protein
MEQKGTKENPVQSQDYVYGNERHEHHGTAEDYLYGDIKSWQYEGNLYDYANVGFSESYLWAPAIVDLSGAAFRFELVLGLIMIEVMANLHAEASLTNFGITVLDISGAVFGLEDDVIKKIGK